MNHGGFNMKKNIYCPIRKNSLYLTQSNVYVQAIESGKTHFIYYDFSNHYSCPANYVLREFHRLLLLHGILCVKTPKQYSALLRHKLNNVFKEENFVDHLILKDEHGLDSGNEILLYTKNKSILNLTQQEKNLGQKEKSKPKKENCMEK